MTTNDWIIDLVLIALVLRQVRESRFDLKSLLLPVGLVGWTISKYLHAIPTAGNDVELVALMALAGGTLGVASGFATRVRIADAQAYVKAGWIAAGLWILGTGTRLAFQLYATHGGESSIADFSRHHDITSEVAWVDGLLLMALCEVAVRLSIIVYRAKAGEARARRVGEPHLIPA